MTDHEYDRIDALTQQVSKLNDALVGTAAEPGHLTKIYGHLTEHDRIISDLQRKTIPCRIAEVTRDVDDLKRLRDQYQEEKKEHRIAGMSWWQGVGVALIGSFALWALEHFFK